MKYRAEIDGLRALAVLPVILFHAGFDSFGGGFVGVDVFFVISGYLITTIIISEMAEKKFSLINFYERRARRILPALFFVMISCLPFAWLWLTPAELKDFGQSLVSVSIFSSNILFWLESDYFAASAELKPLLHTWSLAVEEQYYIIFPMLLMLIWRLGIKWVLVILSIIFLSSLSFSQWGAFNAPISTFYLLPTRAWELLIGVFIAFYLKQGDFLKSNMANQVLSLLGLGMVIYSIIVFDKTTPFPSIYALVPTIGTGLLILCAVPKTFVHKILSLKFIVGVGLISYSAYLWHQPLLAFTKHRLLGEASDFILIIMCILSVIMAWFSWRFVEKPFRQRNLISSKNILIFSSSGLLAFICIGLIINFSKDSLRKLDDEVYRLNAIRTASIEATNDCHSALSGDDLNLILKVCRIGSSQNKQVSFAIIGDSHANALVPGLDNSAKDFQISGYNFTHISCFPSFGGIYYLPFDEVQSKCAKVRRNIKKILDQGDMPSLVFISARWALSIEKDRFNNMEGGEEDGSQANLFIPSSENLVYGYEEAIEIDLFKTITVLKESNVMPVLLGQIPEVGWDPLWILTKQQLFSNEDFKDKDFLSTSYQVFKERNKNANRILNIISDKKKVPLFLPETIFCNLQISDDRCITHINGEPLYYDDDHVSIKGANMIAKDLLRNFFYTHSDTK